MDLSKLSDADLDALESGNLKLMSDVGLAEIERESAPQAQPSPPTAEDRSFLADFKISSFISNSSSYSSFLKAPSFYFTALVFAFSFYFASIDLTLIQT